MFESTDLAYFAGYIDGDGCFHIRKQTIKNSFKYMNSLIIVSVVKETMDFFKEKFKGNVLSKNIISNHKPQYHFVLNANKSAYLINKILPFLIEKRKEAEILIQFFNCKSYLQKDSLIEQMKTQKNSLNLVKKTMKENFESVKNTIIPSIEDFAYLAGFIDAECCLGINRYRSKNRENFLYKILLQCNNTKAPVFKWLLQRFGGQIHFIDRNSYTTKHRDQLTWRLCSSSLFEILPSIYPFLKQKKPVCKELMNFYDTTVSLKGNISRNSPKFREFYLPILQQREVIFHKVQLLNKKGT